jgi:hypothetical protein
VIAAAQAAASWARARRATWTDVPLPRPVRPASVAELAPPYSEPIPDPEAFDDSIVLPGRRPAPVPPSPGPIALKTRALPPWIGRAGMAAAAVLVVGVGGFFALQWFEGARRNATASPSAAPAKPHAKTVGGLKVTSTPDGARVVIDGRDRGITPLTLDDLPVGTHMVSIEAKNGSVQRSVAVSPEYVAQLDEQIFDGFVAVFSPIEIVISEANKVLRPDEHSEIMLSAGTHRLRFVNRALAYDETQTVVVKPGEKTAYNLAPPRSTVSVTASDSAEVFLDGASIGPTPVNAVPAAIGTHELVLKRAVGGEKRMPITVTVKPFTIAVTF